MNPITLDEIDHIRPSLFHLVNDLNFESRAFQDARRSRRRHQLESQLHEQSRDFRHMRLIAIVHADENVSCRRQLVARRNLRLRKRLAEILRHAHHFARRLHLRTEYRINTGKLRPRKHR